MIHRLVCLSLLSCVIAPVWAGMGIDDFSTGGRNFNFNPWSGGDAQLSVDFCVTSVIGRRRTSTTTSPYEIKIRDRGNASAPLQLSNNNGDTLPLSVTFTDNTNNQSEQLSANNYTAQDKTGSLFQCPGGLNARLDFNINQNELANASAGDYQARLRIVVRGGDGNQRRRSNVSLRLSIQDAVQLTGLDDVLLGSYLGSGDLNGREAFCVYRNGAGSYEVTARGNGVSGAFAIQAGGYSIPYTLRWNDGSSDTPISANNTLTGRQNSISNSAHCNGGANNNAEITIDLLEGDLSPAPAGNYNGVLTLIIAPE